MRQQGQLEEAVANHGIVRLLAGKQPADLLGPIVLPDFHQILQEAVPEANFVVAGEGIGVAGQLLDLGPRLNVPFPRYNHGPGEADQDVVAELCLGFVEGLAGRVPFSPPDSQIGLRHPEVDAFGRTRDKIFDQILG